MLLALLSKTRCTPNVERYDLYNLNHRDFAPTWTKGLWRSIAWKVRKFPCWTKCTRSIHLTGTSCLPITVCVVIHMIDRKWFDTRILVKYNRQKSARYSSTQWNWNQQSAIKSSTKPVAAIAVAQLWCQKNTGSATLQWLHAVLAEQALQKKKGP